MLKKQSNGNGTTTLGFFGFKVNGKNQYGTVIPAISTSLADMPASQLSSKENAILQATIGRMNRVSEESYKQRSFANLTPKQRAEILKPLRDEARRNIYNALHLELPIQTQLLNIARKKLFAIPEPTTSASAQRAREIRERLAALPPIQRNEVIERCKRGVESEIVNALATDPFGGPNSIFARDLLHEQIKREHPQEVAALDEQEAAIENVYFGVKEMAKILDKTEALELETLTPQEVMQ
jgi:hypothetical protein